MIVVSLSQTKHQHANTVAINIINKSIENAVETFTV